MRRPFPAALGSLLAGFLLLVGLPATPAQAVGAQACGRVVDDQGNPIVGGRVHAFTYHADGFDGWDLFEEWGATTDSNGDYCTPIPASARYTIEAFNLLYPSRYLDGASHLPRPDDPASTWPGSSQDVTVPTITLKPWVTLTGSVTDPGGSPLGAGTGAFVSVSPHNQAPDPLEDLSKWTWTGVGHDFTVKVPDAAVYDIRVKLDSIEYPYLGIPYSPATTTVNATGGSVSGLVLRLAPAPAATIVDGSGPAITGDPTVGQTLTAVAGNWDGGEITNPAIALSHEWYVAGQRRATGSTYTLQAQDAGQILVLRELASRAGFATGRADSAGVVIQARPIAGTAPAPVDTRSTSTLSAKLGKLRAKHKGKAAVTVKVDGAVPLGKVTVSEGLNVLGSANLTAKHRGKVTIKLKAIKTKGSHHLTIAYAGSRAIKPAATALTARVK